MAHDSEVAVIGGGLGRIVSTYERMRLGLKQVVYEQGRLGGWLRNQSFQGADGIIAELGGMRFPVSSTGFYLHVNTLGLDTKPFPNPLDAALSSSVIDLEGEIEYIDGAGELPPLLREVADVWAEALEAGAGFFGAAGCHWQPRCGGFERDLEQAGPTLGSAHILRFYCLRSDISETIFSTSGNLWTSRFWNCWIG